MRLSLSIALGVGAVSVGVTALMQCLAWEGQRERMQAAHAAAVAAAVGRLEKALVLPVWNLDAEQVRQLVEAELATGSPLREVWVELSAESRLRAVAVDGSVAWSPGAGPPIGVKARPIAAPHVGRLPAGRLAVLDDDSPLQREFEARRRDALLLSALTGLAAALGLSATVQPLPAVPVKLSVFHIAFRRDRVPEAWVAAFSARLAAYKRGPAYAALWRRYGLAGDS